MALPRSVLGWVVPGLCWKLRFQLLLRSHPGQATTAQTRVKDYLNAVRKGRRRAATRRYIAVEMLKPTKDQLEDYKKKQADAKSAAAAGGTQLSNRWVPSSQLRCVMVFDTQSKQLEAEDIKACLRYRPQLKPTMRSLGCRGIRCRRSAAACRGATVLLLPRSALLR